MTANSGDNIVSFDTALSELHTNGPTASIICKVLGLTDIESSDRFGDQIRRILFSGPNHAALNEKLEVVLRDVVDAPTTPSDISYKAFKALIHLHRRNENLRVVRSLLAQYESHFGAYRSFHLLKFTYAEFHTPGSAQLAISYADAYRQEVQDNAGIQNAFAELVVRSVEDGFIANDSSKLLESAKAASALSISIRPQYAKYYATMGRILAQEGDFPSAKNAVLTAIDLEDWRHTDYPIRLQQYAAHLQRIEHKLLIGEVNTHFSAQRRSLAAINDGHRRELDEMRVKNIELIGVFSAVMALIISAGSVQRLTTELEMERLLWSLCGVILISFSGLTFILHPPRYWYRSVPLIALGILAFLFSTGDRVHEMLSTIFL